MHATREKNTFVPVDVTMGIESIAMGGENDWEWCYRVLLAARFIIANKQNSWIYTCKTHRIDIAPFQQLELRYPYKPFNNQSRILCIRYAVRLCLARCCWMLSTTHFDNVSQMRAHTESWPKLYHLNSSTIISSYTCGCSSINSTILIVINFKSSFVAQTHACPRRIQFPRELICISSSFVFEKKASVLLLHRVEC